MSFVFQVADVVWGLLNSSFFTTLIGAFAGAVAALLIVERAARRRELLQEIRNTNAAIMVAFTITNTLLNLKAQHVKKLVEGHQKQRAELEAFKEKRRLGQVAMTAEFHFAADFETLPNTSVPIDLLRDVMFDKLSLVGHSLSLVTTLGQTIDALSNSIRERNALIEEFRDRPANSPDELTLRFYFGLPDRSGHLDRRFPTTVEAAGRYVDDCIFFGKLLTEALCRHGSDCATKYGKTAPKIAAPDFDIAKREGLLPDPADYPAWIEMARLGKG